MNERFITIAIVISLMATTIQVSNTTRQILEQIKKEAHVNSYDQVIQHLVRKHTKIPKSLFGSIPGMRWNKEDDRMKFHDE